jgi:hypothetical protein
MVVLRTASSAMKFRRDCRPLDVCDSMCYSSKFRVIAVRIFKSKWFVRFARQEELLDLRKIAAGRLAASAADLQEALERGGLEEIDCDQKD